jgi:hypothetical protein
VKNKNKMYKNPGINLGESNPVLVKHEVGKGKRSTYNLPLGEHVYGFERKKDIEGAK